MRAKKATSAELKRRIKQLERGIAVQAQAENELRERAEKQRLVIDTIIHGVQEIDTSGKIVFANSAFHEMFGYKDGELIGKLIQQTFLDDETIKKVRDYGQVVFQAQPEPEPWIGKGRKKDGEYIDVQIDWNYLRNSQGEVTGFISVTTDIAERVRMEAALHESEERYQLATNAGQAGVWDWNIETNEIYIDPALKALLGYEDHEIRNHMDDWGKFVHPDDMPEVMSAANAHLEGLTLLYEVEHRMLRKDGRLCWFLARGTAMRDADGKPYRMLGTDTDITERKEMEEALRESEARRRSFMHNFQGIAFHSNLDFIPLFFHGTVKEITGYTAEDFLNGVPRWDQIIHPEDLPAFMEENKEKLQSIPYQPLEREYRIIRKDGAVRWIYDSVQNVCDDSGKFGTVLGAMHDITARVQAEEALRESEARYRSFVQNFQGIAFRSKMDFIPLFFHGAVEEITGYSEVDFLNGAPRWDQVIHPEDLSGFLEEDDEKLRLIPHYTCEREFRILRKDGAIRWVNETTQNICDASGKPVTVQGAVYDITERVQSEEKLRAEHARFVTVMDSLDALVYAADMETYELLFVNQHVREQFGDIVGKTCWKVLQTGLSGPCALCSNDKLLDTDGRPTDPCELEFQNTITGEWYQSRSQAIRWPDGRLVHLEIAMIISDYKRAEEAVRQREQHLEGLKNAVQTLLVQEETIPYQQFVDEIGPVTDASHVYIFINQRDSDGNLLMGLKAEWCAPGITSKLDFSLLQNFPYDKWVPRWRETFLHGEVVSGQISDFSAMEREILESQGILAILVIPIMVDSEFVGLIGFDNCVSACKWEAAEQTLLLAAANDLAQAIKRARSEEQVRASLVEKEVLLREIHHRVKNNMQVIVSLLRLHAKRTDDALVGKVFDDCRDRVNAMALIHEALYQSEDLARIDFKVYIKKLCRNLSRAHGAVSKGIMLTAEHCDVLLGMDQGVALGMVIAELVANAFKHAFPAGKGGRVTVEMSELEGQEIELIVQDDGKGIPAGIDIQNPESLGLKLAIAAVKRELGGSIALERDGGSRFIIRFKGACAGRGE